jgi:hypothetical protein
MTQRGMDMIVDLGCKMTNVFAALTIPAWSLLPAATESASAPMAIPVAGTAPDGAFSGVFLLSSFATQNGQVVANGTLSGVVTPTTGAATSVVRSVVLPVNVTQATCQILHLDLGPIALNLLGLHVDLSQIVLDITAQSGSGTLLGNLVCSVAGLLDDPGGLANVLNQILAAL